MKTPQTAADKVVDSALTRTAQLLSERFQEGTALKERQFEECFEESLQAEPHVRVLAHAGLRLAHWRRAYAIDTTASLPDGGRLVAELKWGVKTLYNCSWDLAKLGVVRGERAAEHAYLVAGAPASEWSGASGAELFGNGEWKTRDLWSRFGKHFDFWAKDVPTTGPVAVPAAMTTTLVSVVLVSHWKGDWTLCASRVEVIDPVWVPWLPQ